MPAPSHTTAYVVVGSAVRYFKDRVGTKSIAGEVDIGTTPVAGRIVRAYARATGALLRQDTTDGAGLYSFADLDGRYTYYVVALDLQPGGQNAAVADYLTPT